MNIEDRLKKLDERIEIVSLEKQELANKINILEERLSELEDDHISLLLYMCVCNNDGGSNDSCESHMHYCICKKLEKRTYNCKRRE